MSDQTTERAKNAAKWAGLIGFLLAAVCAIVPENYRLVCELVTQFCTMGAAR